MNLQQMINNDLNVIFNEDEFAQKHIVNGKDMVIVVDNGKLSELKAKSQYAESISTAEMLIIVRKSVFGNKPGIGSILTIDDDIYRVVMVEEQFCVFEITLEANY